MSETISNGLTLIIPTRNEVDWDSVLKTAFEAISSHDHSGGGNGVQLTGSSFPDNSFDDQKIRLRSNQPLRSRNNAGSGDNDLLKSDTADRTILQAPTEARVAIGGSDKLSVGSSVTETHQNIQPDTANTLFLGTPTKEFLEAHVGEVHTDALNDISANGIRVKNGIDIGVGGLSKGGNANVDIESVTFLSQAISNIGSLNGTAIGDFLTVSDFENWQTWNPSYTGESQPFVSTSEDYNFYLEIGDLVIGWVSVTGNYTTGCIGVRFDAPTSMRADGNDGSSIHGVCWTRDSGIMGWIYSQGSSLMTMRRYDSAAFGSSSGTFRGLFMYRKP